MKGLYPKYNVYKIVAEAFEDKNIRMFCSSPSEKIMPHKGTSRI